MLTKTPALKQIPLALQPARRMNAHMRACAAWATLEEHDKVLDMACGDGALLSYLGDRLRLTLCGMCETPDQARIVREALGEADVISAHVDDIPWRDQTFHAVFMPGALRGEDAKPALAEAYRVLQMGGQFILASPLFHRTETELNRREMMRLMQEAGFKSVSFRTSFLSGVLIGWKKADLPV